MFYVMHQINQTRIVLQEDGVDIFNYTMQNNHNMDSLAYALLDYQRERSTGNAMASKDEYISRFDILYSAFQVIDSRWLGKHQGLAEAEDIVGKGRNFINRYEARINPETDLPDTVLVSIAQEARKLSGDIIRLGHWHYMKTARLRDDISERMDTLTKAFWFFGLTLVVAGSALTIMLQRATRRVSALFEESQATHVQLSKTLEELTSGDDERRAQNRFIAAASHDLRQPLHALGLYLSALHSHVWTKPGRAILENINRSTEALNQLLSSLLDISKLDAGVVDIDQQSFELDDLFEQLHQTFMPEAEERGLALEVQLSGLWVHTDRVLLDRIVRNLISNALNYTPTGSVTLQAEVEADMALLSVVDTGLGIPIEEQQAVFNEYYQLHNPERDRTKGLGLGLSIVRRLTRLLGIRLSVDSSEGNGTRFEMRLPLGEPQSLSTLKPAEPAHSTANSMRGLTILVIDDERDVRDGMQTLLAQLDCQVIVADSAISARRQLIDYEIIPDLILADYRLRDEQTGDDAIEEVREELNEDVPAMIITGDTSPARLKEATASGFKLLHKPVAAEELFASIRQLVHG